MSFQPRAAPAWRRAVAQGVLLAALGALQTLAFVHTALWALPVLGAAVLAALVGRTNTGRAAWFGWCYGTGWLAGGVWWLFISMHRYGGLPALLAALAVVLLSAALAVYLALAMAAYAKWRPGWQGGQGRQGRAWAGDALLFTALWLLAEWARTVLFTGFPWLASGYAQVDSPLAALAPWVGVAGMGAVSAWAAACLAAAWRMRQWAPGLAAVLPVALLAAIGPGEHTQSSGQFSALLLQTNVAQDEKFALERLPQTLADVGRRLRDAKADLVVTPETAVPLLPADLEGLAPGYWSALQAQFSGGARHALVGVPLGDASAGYWNAVVGFGGAAPYQYAKHHLVPFGEFIPTGFRWFTELMNIPLGDFNRGAVGAPPFVMGAQRIAPHICYEDLFGEELARQFAGAPAQDPTALVNISNIAWFGDTVAVPQHLNISRLRALEFQRPLLRATNTGATAHIDHRGQVVGQLPPFAQGELATTVQGRQGRTPYARWAARLGHWPQLALGLALVWAVSAGAVGRRRAGS